MGGLGPSGEVHIFKQRSSGLQHKDTLTSSSYGFGASMALYGNRLLVGAYADTVSGQSQAGSAYVYERSSGQWQQTAQLTASNPLAGENFATSLSLYRRWAAVGAVYGAGNNVQAGEVFIFKRSGSGQWQEKQVISPPNGENFDAFGASVSLEGNLLVVGAPWTDIGGNNYYRDQGVAYVYKRQGNNWNFVQKLELDNPQPSDFFGWASLIKDGKIYVTAPQSRYGGNNTSTGAVYVFENQQGTWQQIHKIQAAQSSTSSFFGHALAVENNTLLVGANNHSDSVTAEGAVYMFEEQNGQWQQISASSPQNPATYDQFGTAVALSNGYSYVASRGDDEAASNAGALYVHY